MLIAVQPGRQRALTHTQKLQVGLELEVIRVGPIVIKPSEDEPQEGLLVNALKHPQ
jgi:hypothetical protein